MGRPLPFAVWWLPDGSEERQCEGAASLGAARRIASRENGVVYARKNIRPSESAPGTWDYDEEMVED